MPYTLKCANGRYSFSITDNKKEIYNSSVHFFLIPGFKSDYQYAWEACSDLRKLISGNRLDVFKKKARGDFEEPVVTDISAEQMLSDYYLSYLDLLQDKMSGAKTRQDKKDVIKEIEMVMSELEHILEQIDDEEDKKNIIGIIAKYKQIIIDEGFAKALEEKVASIDKETVSEVMEEYARKTCEAIQYLHPSAIYSVDKNMIVVCDKKPNEENKDVNYEPIVKVCINKNLNPDSIFSCGNLYKTIPYHSAEFFQKYWKPITEAIGHFFVRDLSALIMSSNLPDMLESSDIEAWDTEANTKKVIRLSFEGEKPIWLFKSLSDKMNKVKTASKYQEQDYFNKIVKCIDVNLKSIAQRTGSVVQIIPLTDHTELDVDFGRGLGITRLSADQVEIVM